MRDVSRTVFTAVLEALASARVDPEGLRRLRADTEGLGDWRSWDQWADFLARVENLTRDRGGARWVGEFFSEVPAFAPLGRVYAMVSTPRLNYTLVGRWVGNFLFPLVDCDTVDLKDGRLRQTLTLPESYRDSREFFDLMFGGLVSAPRFLRLPSAHVEMTREPRRAIYTIVPPPPMTLSSRLFRGLRTMLAGSDQEGLRLFSHLIESLQDANRELERQRALIQARAEALEEALLERDELLAENQRVTDQLQKARDELVFALAEERADPLLVELLAAAGHSDHREVIERFLALLRTLPPTR